MRNKKYVGVEYSIKCNDCACTITIDNSSTASHARRTDTPRCGKCYLSWKAAERKRRGKL